MLAGETMECAGKMCGITETGSDGSLSHGMSPEDLCRSTQKSAVENVGAKRKTQLLGEQVQKAVLGEADMPGEPSERNLAREVTLDPVQRRQHTFIHQNPLSARLRQGTDEVFGLQKHLRTLGRLLQCAAEEFNMRSQELIGERTKRFTAQKAIVKMTDIPGLRNHMQ